VYTKGSVCQCLNRAKCYIDAIEEYRKAYAHRCDWRNWLFDVTAYDRRWNLKLMAKIKAKAAHKAWETQIKVAHKKERKECDTMPVF